MSSSTSAHAEEEIHPAAAAPDDTAAPPAPSAEPAPSVAAALAAAPAAPTPAAPTPAAPTPAPDAAPAPKGSKEETSKGAIAEKFASASTLDMVFIMDCTGSMGSYIAAAQATIAEIVQEIVAAEKADVRFALIAYRDHPPQDSTYVVHVDDFSFSVKTMRTNLNALSANGGGDGPEAVVDGLHAASKLDFREGATKVVILIADAPPHGLGGSGDGFPNGCPCGLDPMVVCRQLAERDIALYCIGCEPSITPYKTFFMAMAHLTGGQYCPLGDAKVLSSAVVSGVREEMSLAAALSEVKVALENCGDMDERMQEEFVHNKLKEKNVRSKQMRHDGGGSALNADAIAMSKAASLDAIRGKYNMTSGGDDAAAHGGMLAMESCVRRAPAKKKSAGPGSGGAGGGLFGSVRRFLGLGSETGAAAATASAMADGGPECEEEEDGTCPTAECAAAPMARAAMAPMAAPAAAMPSSYSVVEDDISMEQTSRLMNKARFQKK